MTVYEKIDRAVRRDEGVTLNNEDTRRVLYALTWARRQLGHLNAEGGDTDGGNAETSGLDEQADD